MFKPSCMVFAITNSLKTLKFLKIVRGVHPIVVDGPVEDMERTAVELAKENGLIKPGGVIVFVGSNKDSIVEGGTCSLRIIVA